jgi:hypothetical protein
MAWKLQKDHCREGHPFTPENTIRLKNGYRTCRICRNARAKQYRDLFKGGSGLIVRHQERPDATQG